MHGERLTQTHRERNYGVLRSWFPRWAWNTACNFAKIRQEFLREGKRYALADYKHTCKGPALIVGAGPSFDKAAPFLKDWKGALFASESMASTCLYHGRDPEYIAVYDGHPSIHDLFLNHEGIGDQILLAHPAINEKVINTWRGEKRYYVMMHLPSVDMREAFLGFFKEEGDDTLPDDMTIGELRTRVAEYDDNPDHGWWIPFRSAMLRAILVGKNHMFGDDFFTAINPILFSYIRTMILNAGCVVNNMIQCASFMGYSPIFLAGVDFGYPDDMHRATGYRHDEHGEWAETKPFKVEAENIGRTLHRSNNGILTTEEQIEYKTAMMDVYMQDVMNLWDCSEGIVTELPKTTIGEVIEHYERSDATGTRAEARFPARSVDEVKRVCMEYHNSQKGPDVERDVNRENPKVLDMSSAGD